MDVDDTHEVEPSGLLDLHLTCYALLSPRSIRQSHIHSRVGESVGLLAAPHPLGWSSSVGPFLPPLPKRTVLRSPTVFRSTRPVGPI
ncbi:hypothetical protein SAMN05444515_1141 [Ectothiorhodospira marina]|uniref:Uncharacterized protein n=1 Tax=Ectothiorhodospira marina TaxID=1396821 RepID=A0A1H7PFK6_9GAMM|nr:hypothetical protein SAMN05444515_1141 [Ectothiorhodospira marina]